MAVGGEITPSLGVVKFLLQTPSVCKDPERMLACWLLGFGILGMDCFLGGALLASLLVDCFLAFELPKGSRFPSLGLALWASYTLCFSELVPLRLSFPYFCTFKIC